MNIEKRILRIPQRAAYYYCNRVDFPALFMEMRLGKTLVTIRHAVKHVRFRSGALIVAPYSAIYSWLEELKTEGYEAQDMNLLTGSRESRLNRLNKHRTQWNFINREGFLYLPEIAHIDWDMIVLDESTFIKNYDTKVSQFYSKSFQDIDHKYILTGTPMPESELDIFQQLLFLNPEILPFNNYYDFRYKCFTQGTRVNRKWIITQDGKQYLTNKLAKYCFTMSRKDAGIGQGKVYEKRYLKLSNKDRKVYNTIAKEFLLEYKSKVEKVTDFATTKFIWLRQLCSGYFTNDKGTTQINNNKTFEIINLMKGELKNSSVVVWCVFTHEIIRLKRLLIHNDIYTSAIFGKIPIPERENRRKDFMAGNIQVLICQPECFKHGAKLSIADTSIYYSSPLGNETRLQTEDRMLDVSKDESDLVIDLITENTIEQDIYDNLKSKATRQNLMLYIVKRLQRELKNV